MVSANSSPGSSDATIYTDGFHDRLSRYWPEPREQLHAGGWRQTRAMLLDIKRLAKGRISRALDLCCGEGATAAYVAATEGWDVTGIDIVQSAVNVARAHADEYGTVIRAKLSVPGTVSPAVRMMLSYDTVVRVKLSADEGESAVRLSLSYDAVVRVALSAVDSPPPPPLAPIHLNLTYDTGLRVGLVVTTAAAAAKAVSLKLSHHQAGVLARLTQSPVKLTLSCDAAAVHAKLTEGSPIKLGVSCDGSGVHAKLSEGTPVKLGLSYDSDYVHARLTEGGPVKLGLLYGDGCVHVKLAPAADGVPAVRINMSHQVEVHAKLEAVGDASLVNLTLSYEEVKDKVQIVHGSIHQMPLPSNTFDVVYGQDPDGLANEDRIHAFKEVLRVLRPGGLFYFWHHWIPGPGWPAELLSEYWSDPFTGSPRLSHECYLQDLEASGLQVAFVSDCTALARSHMGAMAARMRAEAPGAAQGGLPDKWLERTLEFAEGGGTMGILVAAYRPL